MNLRSCLILFLCLAGSKTNAQQNVAPVTGHIFDKAESANGLAGVTVTAALSRATALSESDGSFTISLARLPDTLRFTRTGYLPHTLIITSPQQNLQVALQRDPRQLDEVILNSGYQSFSRQNAVGAYSTVDNTLFNRQTTTGIIERLDGLATALRFDRRPGAEAPIQIRGISSLLQNTTAPLIIVDNFPYEGDIANINPNDVKDITILKDAAAASVWGASAGNGVIVITTKTGRPGQPLTISLTSSVGIRPRPDLFDVPVMSAADVIAVETFLFNNNFYNSSLSSPTGYPALTPVVEILAKQRQGTISPSAAQAQLRALAQNDVRHDVSRYLYQDALAQQYNLNLSWGTKTTTAYLSGGLDHNTQSLQGNSYNRITFKSDISTAIAKKWKLSSATFFTVAQSQSNSPGELSSLKLGASRLPLYTRLADDNGNPLPLAWQYREQFTDTAGNGRLLSWKYSPLTELANGDNTGNAYSFTTNLTLGYRLSKALSAEIKTQYQAANTINTNYRSTGMYYTRDLINLFTQISSTGIKYILPNGGILDKNYSLGITKAARAQLNFSREWQGRHQLTAFAAAEIRQTKTGTQAYRTYGYNDANATASVVDYINYYPTYNNVSGSLNIPRETDFRQTNMRFVSLLSNVAYTYNNKYTITATARKDASNIFGVTTNQKGTPLGSLGGRWKLSQERFYKNPKWPTLAMRAAFGYSGNFSPDVSARTLLQYNSASFQLTNIPSASIQGAPNPGLRWQKVSTFNIGLDAATQDQRLSARLDFYMKNTKDLLSFQDLDPTGGISSMITNSADLSGRGWDLELNSVNLTGTLKWNTAFLFSYTTTRITRMGKTFTDNATNYLLSGKTISPHPGYKPYAILAYRWGGLSSQGLPQGYQADTLTTNYQLLRTQPAGTLITKGQGIPPYFGAVRNELAWHHWSLAFNITYKLGYWFVKDAISYSALYNNLETHPDFSNRWQQPGDELRTNIPAMIYPAPNAMDAFFRYAEINVLKAGQVRFDWFNLSYSLQKVKGKKNPFQTVRLFANANNLNWLLWRANKENLDPDFQYSIKPSKTITLGCNINF